MKINKISIIVPAYNESRTIKMVYDRIARLDLGKTRKEIIIVDDHSTDGTAQIIRKFSGEHTALFHKNNLGKGAAIRSGLEKATGDYVVIQDADTEYDPEEIKKLIEKAEKDDLLVVYGSRDSGIKNKYLYPHFYWGSRMLAEMVNILFNQRLTDPETCYKLIQTDLFRFLGIQQNGFGVEVEISAKISGLGFPIGEVPITYNPRTFAEGKKIKIKDGLEAVGLVWKYYIHDLHYGLVDRWLRREREKALERNITFELGDTVLDIGCGRQAHLGWKIRTKVKKYIGLDLETPPVKVANIELKRADVGGLEKTMRGIKVDKIVGLAVIEHVEDPERFLKDALKVLSKGGIVALTTPPPWTRKLLEMLGRWGIIDEKEIDDHKTYFDLNTLAELMNKTGLRVVHKNRFLWGMNSVVVGQKD